MSHRELADVMIIYIGVAGVERKASLKDFLFEWKKSRLAQA